MSLSVKLAACLDALGFAPGEDIDWDHTWALGLRPRTADGGYDPPANDPRYIRPRRRGEHAVKTRGNAATVANGDIHKIAKAKRLAKEQEEFRRRVLTREPGQPRERKGKIRGRGFKRQERKAG